jgi:hypothetical protein
VVFYFPRHLNVETSDYCNRSCAWCPVQRDRGSGPARLLDLRLWTRLCEELRVATEQGLELKISMQWVDEPLTNPKLLEYVDKGRELVPDAKWLLQTNGDFLDGEKLEALKSRFDAIAVNFYSDKAHDRFCDLELDYVPARGMGSLQSPGRLKAARGFEERRGEAVVHINEKYRGEDWVDWHDDERRAPDDACGRIWEQASIAWDGKVFTCCRDNLREHPVGDLAAESLFEAYNSPAARRLREHMEAGQRDRIDMCRTCDSAFAPRFDVPEPSVLAVLAERGRAAEVGLEGRDRELLGERLPWGRYDYVTARNLARELGHVALPGVLPRRYEYIVGVTADVARGIRDVCLEVAGDALQGVVICGGRVMTRQHLARVDPSVFLYPVGPLRVGNKERLREFGTSPARSSDLDVKVLVDDTKISAVDAERLAPVLGDKLEGLGAPIPISGHLKPLVRLLRVPSSCDDARSAYGHYNDHRAERLGKGPLSLEYSQVLYDRAAPDEVMGDDATRDVRACLTRGEEDARRQFIELKALDPSLASDWKAPFSQLYKEQVSGLSFHQLVCALTDFPALEPSDVRVEQGRVTQGGFSVRAALVAGRERILCGTVEGEEAA